MKGCSVYIVLTRPNTIISKIIHVVKQDQYTHASISLDKDLHSMYSFGREFVYVPFIGRFKREDIDEGLYKFHKNLPGLVMEIEVTKEQYNKAKDLLNTFIINSNLYKYNYQGLLDGLFKKPASYENRFLCSEFVYHILKDSEIADLNIPANLVRPQNLLAIKSNIIFEGNLKKFNNVSNSPIILKNDPKFVVMPKKAIQ